jgi:uncharacterized protein (TIGR02996 family)
MSMTSDGDALFRAICEQPWEDTPRLVYADWLEEHGDALRAEFIRVQIELARETDKARIARLAEHADRLRAESAGRWTRGSPTRPGVRIGYELRRGFYHEVAFDGRDAFARFADEVFAWAPVDAVSLRRESGDSLRKVLTSRYAPRLVRLSLSLRIGDRGCLAIAACAKFAHLEELNIPAAGVTDAGALAIANSPHLPALLSFQLGGIPHLATPTVALLKKRFNTFIR